MIWLRPLLFLTAIILSETIGFEVGLRHYLLAWSFLIVIPLVLVGLWLFLALEGPRTTPRERR
jgi:hypothetical protein